jgi:type II secretory pathway pseudopilin PulG
MIFVSLAGVIIAFMGDTLYQSAQRGALTDLPSGVVLTVIIGLGAVISINIAAFIGIQITDPNTRKEQAAQEAQDEIEEAAIAQIRASSKMLATELAPRLGQAWVDEMRARYGAALPELTPARRVLPHQTPPIIAQPETLEAKDENPLELDEALATKPAPNGHRVKP